MRDRVVGNTKELLRQYLQDVRSLPNEAAKTNRFTALVGALFPGSAIISKLTAGIEKAIRIELPGGTRRGRIDSYFGNAIIEFEQSLKATGNVAEQQLRDYCAGLWTKEGKPYRPLLAVATDAIVWRTYRPSLVAEHGDPPQPGDVGLEPLAELTVAESNLSDFYIWLNGLLFRTGQVLPSTEQFKQDFGKESLAYCDAVAVLREAWRNARRESEAALAYENWQRYLTVTYGALPEPTGEGGESDELEELFLKHTYLASIARLMIWASTSKGKSRKAYSEVAQDVFSGTYFRARGLANLVEDDFFRWIRSDAAVRWLNPVWERIIAQIQTYDLSRLNQDVLKGVYQELVDPKDRHDLGEYYTPDWLCERVVAELLPETGYVKVLDPACGSGSFLRAVISHFLERDSSADATRLQRVLDHVVGIDVHPLAVTIAKATYVLALGRVVQAAKRPVEIPVYMADSLFLPTEVRQMKFGGALNVELSFGGKKVIIPESMVTSAEVFDAAVSAASAVAVDHARKRSETAESLDAYLLRAIRPLAKHHEREQILKALWSFTEALAELIQERHNSIWAFIIRNSYRPAMLGRQFDVILGNPPWLSYRYIADPEYQEEIKKRAVEEYRIAPNKQRLMTQMELATVFVAHSMGWFAADGAKLGFVMPRSILSGDQHENLRLRKYSAKCRFRMTAYWDMMEVAPLFKVPACVLFAEGSRHPGSPDEALPVKRWFGKLDTRDCSWAVAAKQLSFSEGTGRVVYLAKRSAFSTMPGPLKPGTSSAYADVFRQGATIVPRCFYFVRASLRESPLHPDGIYWAETDPEQLLLAKKPYHDVRLSGQVEGRFFFFTVLARHVLPFTLLTPSTTVIPMVRHDQKWMVLTAAALKRRGHREFGNWVEEAERIWTAKRGRKADKVSLYEWLDYQGKLTRQWPATENIVLYNSTGTNVSAVRVRRSDYALHLLVEHTVYWAPVSTAEEGEYLAGVLNSSVSNEAIKPFQAMGLMGERHVEKKLMDLPIPKFDPSEPRHAALAELGRTAQEKAAQLIRTAGLPRSLARQRGWLRDQLKRELEEIDRIVKTIL